MEQHTKAKHLILEQYLKGWFPIIGKHEKRIVYLDGFAGPGIYTNDEEGSPIIAIKTAINNTQLKRIPDIRFLFIDKDQKRIETLEKTLKIKFSTYPDNIHVKTLHANFSDELNSILDEIEEDNSNLAPTFAFLDPFGYDDFSIDLIKRVLSYRKCEVLITFVTGSIRRFLDPSHEKALDALYGTSKWRDAREIIDSRKKLDFLLELYIKQLKQKAGVKHVKIFEMIRQDNNVTYHLVFCTNHWKGIEVMQNAMLKVDPRGLYKFSDRITFEQTFFYIYAESDDWIPGVADTVFAKFKGKKVAEEKIHEFVIVETNHIYKKTKILKYLEEQKPPKIIEVIGRKRKGFFYPEKCLVKFAD